VLILSNHIYTAVKNKPLKKGGKYVNSSKLGLLTADDPHSSNKTYNQELHGRFPPLHATKQNYSIMFLLLLIDDGAFFHRNDDGNNNILMECPKRM
jgi:hypothetical protein